MVKAKPLRLTFDFLLLTLFSWVNIQLVMLSRNF